MAHLKKTAGSITLDVFTDGHPLNFTLVSGQDDVRIFTEEGLHDLKFCVDRMLALLAEHHASRAGSS